MKIITVLVAFTAAALLVQPADAASTSTWAGVTYTLGRMTLTSDWLYVPIAARNDTAQFISKVWFKCKVLNSGILVHEETIAVENLLPGSVGYSSAENMKFPDHPWYEDDKPLGNHVDCLVDRVVYPRDLNLLERSMKEYPQG